MPESVMESLDFNPFQASSVGSVSTESPPDDPEDIGDSVSAPVQVAAEAKGGTASASEPVKNIPEPPAEEKPKDDAAERFSKQFEKMSRKELELRQKEQELKTLAGQVQSALKLQELVKTDKRAALRELNVSVDEVLRDHLNGGKPDTHEEIAALRAEIAELKSVVPKIREEHAELGVVALEDIGNRWDRDFEDLMARDEYKIIKHWPGGEDHVRNEVVKYYDEHKKILPAKYVLDMISKELRDRYDAVSKHMAPVSSVAAQPAPPPPDVKTTGPKTMSPKLSAMPRYSYARDSDEEFADIVAKHTRR